jgi:hypothetical protein
LLYRPSPRTTPALSSCLQQYHSAWFAILFPEAASLSMQGCYSHGPVDTHFRIVRAAAATAPRWLQRSITRQQACLSHHRVQSPPAHSIFHVFGPIGTVSLAVLNVADSRRLVYIGRRVLLLSLCSRHTSGCVLQSIAIQVVHVAPPVQAPLDHKDSCSPLLRLDDLLRARLLLRFPSLASKTHQQQQASDKTLNITQHAQLPSQ